MTKDVAANYVHRDQFTTPHEGFIVGESQLKWNKAAPLDAPVPEEIEKLARGYLKVVRVAGDLGFAVLHRCGGSSYFLLVSTWRNANELWESVNAKANAGEAQFRSSTFTSAHRGTYCVWELGAVWLEQQARNKFLTPKRAT